MWKKLKKLFELSPVQRTSEQPKVKLGELERELAKRKLKKIDATVEKCLTLRELMGLQVHGDLERAEHLIRKSLLIASEKLTANDPEFLIAYSRAGSFYFLKEEFELAAESFECALPAVSLKSDIVEFSGLLNNAAVCYMRLGEVNKATDLMERVVEFKKEHLGNKHPEILENLEDLVQCYLQAGDLISARERLTDVEAIVANCVGKESTQYRNLTDGIRSLDEEISRGNSPLSGSGEINPVESAEVAPSSSFEELAEKVRSAYNKDELETARRLHSQYLAMLPSMPLPGIGAEFLKSEMDPILSDISAWDRAAHENELAGQFDLAEKLYIRAFEALKVSRGRSHPDLAMLLNNMALLAKVKGDYPHAKKLFREALDVSFNAPELLSFGETLLINIAEMFMKLADDRAPSPADDFAESLKGLEDKPSDYATSLRMRFPIPNEDNDPIVEASRQLDARAKYYDSLADVDRTDFLYSLNVEMLAMRWAHQPSMTAEAMLQLAENCMDRGSFTQGISIADEIIENVEMSGASFPDKLFSAMGLKAQGYTEMADYDGAEDLIDEMARLLDNSDLRDTNARAIIEDYRITVKLKAGKAEEVSDLIIEKLSTIEGDLEQLQGDQLQEYGALACQVNDFEQSEKLLRAALEKIEESEGEWHLNYGLALSNLGTTLRCCGRFEEAADCFQRAAEIRIARLGENHESVANAKIRLAIVLAAAGRCDEALKAVDDAVLILQNSIGELAIDGSQSQMLSKIVDQGKLIDVGLTILCRHEGGLVDAGIRAYRLILKRKNVSAELFRAHRRRILSGSIPELKAELEELDKLVRMLSSEEFEGDSQSNPSIRRAKQQRKKLEAKLSRKIGRLGLDRSASDDQMNSIVEAIPDKGLLIEFGRYKPIGFKDIHGDHQGDAYVAIVLSKNEKRSVDVVWLDRAEEIDELIDEFNSAIAGEASAFPRDLVSSGPSELDASLSRVKQVGMGLHASLLAPLEDFLKGRKVVIIGTEGHLSQLSFEALPISDSEFVLDRYVVSYVGSGLDLIRRETGERVDTAPAVVLADPDFGLTATNKEESDDSDCKYTCNPINLRSSGVSLAPLPGALEEGQMIAKIIGEGECISGSDANKSLVKNLANPRILHFATHGFFIPKVVDNMIQSEPLSEAGGAMIASGLALAGANTWFAGGALPEEAENGLLLAEEVATLNLVGTEMVVLSACVSGVGFPIKGEGVFGLRRAFLVAGANSLVMSLWKVPDRETRDLMVNFYRRLASGVEKNRAFSEAKAELRKRSDHPFYWAAFVLEGDPRPVSPGHPTDVT